MKHAILILLLMPSLNLLSQDNPLKGLGAEIGLGQSYLFWSVDEGASGDRTRFFLKPNVRMSYAFKVYDKISAIPFAGWMQFGGRSGTDTSGYKDGITFSGIDFGAFLVYPVKSWSLGVGAKGNYHLDMTNRSYGYGGYQEEERRWHESDISFFFKKWSVDAGARLEYGFHEHWSTACEFWTSATPLQKSRWSDLSIHQTNVRIMIGYRL